MTTSKLETMKKDYINLVYDEMKNRGFSSSDIPNVIAKTGFMDALNSSVYQD